jgi:hypothetical protein
MKYYLIVACMIMQAYVHAMDNNLLQRDFKPGLYQKHQNGAFIKLPLDTWFKEKDDGHIIQPASEQDIVPVLNGLVMMVSGFTTGILALGKFGWPALCVSGTILASSMIIKHQISPYLSPDDQKHSKQLGVYAVGGFVIGLFGNFKKSDQN